MNRWTLKYHQYRVGLLGAWQYGVYRFRTATGLKSPWRSRSNELVIFHLLKKYETSFSCMVDMTDDDLDKVDLSKLHGHGFRYDPADLLEIFVNTDLRQIRLVVGIHVSEFVSDAERISIQSEMQTFGNRNEILRGLEAGMKRIKEVIAA